MRHTAPTPEQLGGWHNWVDSRPECIRELIRRRNFDPWTLYRLKTTDQRVTLVGFHESEDDKKVTLMVDVSGDFNFVIQERVVFGVDPDDLEECDLPSEGEILGNCDLSQEEVDRILAEARKHYH